MHNSYCGLDFGTSNSAVSRLASDEPELISISDNSTVPSALFFNIEDETISYGKQALNEYLDGCTGRLLRSLKSVLGSNLINEKTQVGYEVYSFKEVIELFLRYLKENAEKKIQNELKSVVIGRPVYFVDNDLNADRKAEQELSKILEKIGFKEIVFEYEPIAAAVSYERKINSEQLVLVFDVGGGTSDFSVIKLSPHNLDSNDRSKDILANSGVHIGGTDFDKYFSLKTVMPDMGYQKNQIDGLVMPSTPYHSLATWHLINRLYANKQLTLVKQICSRAANKQEANRLIEVLRHKLGHKLASTIEAVKIELTHKPNALINLEYIDDTWKKETNITELESSLELQFEKIFSRVSSTIRDAGIKHQDIDAVFMTGGSSALPSFKKHIEIMFPDAKVVQENIFSAVASGLAITARNRFN